MCQIDTHPPEVLSWMTAVLSGILCLLTVPGNLLVCLAVFKDPYKDLRSPFTLLIAQLALADLIVGLVTEPISVYVHVREALKLSNEYIWLVHITYFIACTASVLSIGALTVDRYVAITNPFKYRAKQGFQKPKITLVSIWIISLSLPLIYFQVGYIMYTFVFANTSVVLTFIILLVVQVKVRLSSRSRVIGVAAKNQGKNTIRKKLLLREKHITKTFVYVLIAYVTCYFPSCVIIYVMNFCTTCNCLVIHWLRDTQFLFILFNSLVNPIIYAWRLPSFRRTFVAMVKPCSHVTYQSSIDLGLHNNAAKENKNDYVKSIEHRLPRQAYFQDASSISTPL